MLTRTMTLQLECQRRGLRYVGTRGVTGGPICFVGEAPGADEDQSGIPFVGAAGRELDRMLSEVHIDQDQCWWTNPYKVKPPDNKLGRLGELGIAHKMFEDQFTEEMFKFRPTLIVALGATALKACYTAPKMKGEKPPTITNLMGSLLVSDKWPWEHYVLPAIHPAGIFRAWDQRQLDVLCFAKLWEEYQYWRHNHTLQPLPQRQLISDPPADDAIDALTRILNSPEDTVVSVDIENIGVYSGKHKAKARSRVPYVIGFSIDPSQGISIGFGEYPTDKAVQVWRLMDAVLRRKRQVGQNYYTHDLPWLQYIGFSPTTELCHDTLVRHHTLWPELSHKLEFQTFQYTREPYYKDEGRSWRAKDPASRSRMKAYNCKDVCVTLEIFREQEKEFDGRH